MSHLYSIPFPSSSSSSSSSSYLSSSSQQKEGLWEHLRDLIPTPEREEILSLLGRSLMDTNEVNPSRPTPFPFLITLLLCRRCGTRRKSYKKLFMNSMENPLPHLQLSFLQLLLLSLHPHLLPLDLSPIINHTLLPLLLPPLPFLLSLLEVTLPLLPLLLHLQQPLVSMQNGFSKMLSSIPSFITTPT